MGWSYIGTCHCTSGPKYYWGNDRKNGLQQNRIYEGGFSLTFATDLGLFLCCSYMFNSLVMATYCLETICKEDLLVRTLIYFINGCIFLTVRLLNPCKHNFRLAGRTNLSLMYQGWCTSSTRHCSRTNIGIKSHFCTVFDLLLYSHAFCRHSVNCLIKKTGYEMEDFMFLTLLSFSPWQVP